ncbi:MAG: ATP-binding protein [Planctomycetota bacterium]
MNESTQDPLPTPSAPSSAGDASDPLGISASQESSSILLALTGRWTWTMGCYFAQMLLLLTLNQLGLLAFATFCVLSLFCSVTAFVLWKVQRGRDGKIREVLSRQRKEIEDENQRYDRLHRQSLQNAMVLSRMSDGVIVISPDWSVLMMNPQAQKLLGLRQDDPHLGGDLRAVARLPELVSAVESVLHDGQVLSIAMEIPNRGRINPISLNVRRLSATDDGNVLLTLHDETEAKRLELVRREFIANVSHELKTPLAAIKGYAETVELAIDDDPSAATHFMSQIREQCLRLERLVAGMLQLARAQAGSDQLRLSTVEMADVIGESMKTYQPVADAKRIRLERGEFEDEAKAFVDREAVLTIANNLIGNAIRYTPEGGGVTISLKTVGNECRLVVSDDGVGIDKKDLKRVFERFYRVEKTRESATSGTGLGLSIVRNLTNALQARVEVDSHPGRGSVFTVWLPTSATAKPDSAGDFAPAAMWSPELRAASAEAQDVAGTNHAD